MSTHVPPAPRASASELPSSIRWRIVLLLMALSFMSWFNRTSMTVAADLRIAEQFGFDETRMGAVYSSFFVVYAVLMIPGGWFTDKYGPSRSLFLMGLGTACFVALTGVLGLLALSAAMFYPLLLAVRGSMGFFAVPMYPAASRMVRGWIPLEGRAWANGIITAAALVGNASTFVLFGALIGRVGWPHAFLIAGIATALLALVWITYARDDPDRHSGVNAAERALIRPAGGDFLLSNAQPAAWLRLLRHRSILLLTLSYAAIGYFQYLFFFWTEHYFLKVLEIGEERSRYYATIVNLAMAVGMAAGGVVSDRLQGRFGLRVSRSLVPIVGMLAAACFLGIGLQTLNPDHIVVWFSLALGSLGLSEGSFWATAAELGSGRGATIAGLMNTGGNVGGVIAPVMTPWVQSIMPQSWEPLDRWRVAIGIGAVVAFLGAGLWFWIDPRDTLEPGRLDS